MGGCLGDLIGRVVGTIIINVVLLPAVLVLSTPVVLVLSAVKGGPFWLNVRDYYGRIKAWWMDQFIYA
jgi:hypothetical protein